MNPELEKEPKTEEKTESKPPISKTKQNKKETTITSYDVDVNYS